MGGAGHGARDRLPVRVLVERHQAARFAHPRQADPAIDDFHCATVFCGLDVGGFHGRACQGAQRMMS
jgi:hypothetical protein